MRLDVVCVIVDKVVVFVVDGVWYDWMMVMRDEGDEVRRRLKLSSARRYGGGRWCEDVMNE